MSVRARIEIRYATYAILVLLILFTPAFAVAVAPTPVVTTLNVPSDFDASNLFRLAVGALIGLLIFLARGQDVRLSKAEARIEDFNQINAVRTEKIGMMESNIMVLKHDQAQLESMIGLLRETVLTKYEEKDNTERHRQAVEEKLTKQAETLISICYRLDHMARPLHRATDDQNNEYRRRAADEKAGDSHDSR